MSRAPALAGRPGLHGFLGYFLASQPLGSEMEKCLLPGTMRAEEKRVKRFELCCFWDQALASVAPTLGAQLGDEAQNADFCYFMLQGPLFRFSAALAST